MNQCGRLTKIKFTNMKTVYYIHKANKVDNFVYLGGTDDVASRRDIMVEGRRYYVGPNVEETAKL